MFCSDLFVLLKQRQTEAVIQSWPTEVTCVLLPDVQKMKVIKWKVLVMLRYEWTFGGAAAHHQQQHAGFSNIGPQ